MSEKNEALVRRLHDEVWNKGNVKLLDEMLTTDCVRHDPVDPGRGIESARSTIRRYRTAFPDCRLDIEELMSVGDRVVVRWRYSGTQRAPLEGIPATGKHVSGIGDHHPPVRGRQDPGGVHQLGRAGPDAATRRRHDAGEDVGVWPIA